MNKPNLFIVGFPKSGTSSLYSWLKEHPDVIMSNKKEPSFFATDFKIKSQIKNKLEYLRLFEGVNKKIIGEASTTYIYSKKAPIKIKKFQPKAKIIIIYRDYAEMLESLYIHRVHRTGDPIRGDFHKWFKRRFIEKEGKVNGNIYPFWNLLHPLDLIKKYTKLFGRKNVKIIDFNKLKNEPETTYNEVCTFLKIPNFKPSFRIQNKSFGPKSKILEKLGFTIRKFLKGDSWNPKLRFWEKNRIKEKPSYLTKEEKNKLSLIFEKEERKILTEMII